MPINKIAHSSLEENQQNYINILRSGHSVTDTGWATYSDSAGVNPVDGIGGTASITWSQNTSSPLSGESDLRLVKDAVNRQGDGVSIPFTIANRHLGKVLQITCDMELISGTHASGDLRVSIIQDPTGTPVVLEPVGTSLELGIANQRMREIATFQSHISITSYRLCIHVSSTSASAYTVDFANFKVWEPTQSVGAVITDWQSFTMTIGATTTAPTKASNAVESAKWRRVGSLMEIKYSYYHTSSTGASSGNGDYLWSIPSGFSIDTSVIPSSTTSTQARSHLGEFIASNGTDMNSGQVRAYDSTRLILRFNNGSPAGSIGSSGYPFASTSSMEYSFSVSIPIAGWGSSVAMSSDTGDGRLIGGSVSGHTSRAYTTDVTVIRTNTVIKDSHSSYNTGVITIPISGDYVFGFNFFYLSVGSQANIKVFKNGSFTGLYAGQFSSSFVNSQSIKIDNLKAGDTIDFRSGADVSIPTETGMMISWHRISTGSQVIATTETVACSVNKTSGSVPSGGTPPNRVTAWNTKDLDTHGSFDLTNGTFTVPMSGVYLINACANNFNFTSYNQPGFTIRVGTTILSISTMYFTSNFEPELSTSALRRFVAGDIISLYGYGNGFACNNLIMNISRIGI